MTNADWSAANQRVLVAEFARLRATLDGRMPDHPGDLEEANEAMSRPASIDVITRAFELSQFERDLLLLCAGAEMDESLAAACARPERADQAAPTFDLALSRLSQPHWSALAPTSPLRRWMLIELEPGANLVTSRLRIDERILHYLAGVNFLDRRLAPVLSILQAHGRTLAYAHAAIAGTAHLAICDCDPCPAVMMPGDDAAAKKSIAAQIASRLNATLYLLRSSDIPRQSVVLDGFVTLCQREARLANALLLLDVEPDDDPIVAKFVKSNTDVLFVIAPERLNIGRQQLVYRIDRPSSEEQVEMWKEELGDIAEEMGEPLGTIATQFRLDTGAILSVAELLREDARPDMPVERQLWEACRREARCHFSHLAQRVEAVATWDDLVLPDHQQKILRQIAAHVRWRTRVNDAWGFARSDSHGAGVSALFAGESGTGKTMAAEVLANELQLDLYRIDLSALVSKYIGETEKNLSKVFEAAESGGAILLFDEADALFGKRSEVKDSHDRYANMEVSYLLQRMETYRGLAILTTNLKQSLDPAFLRRLRFIVQFPFPDAELRARIWRRAFPASAPIDRLDFVKLAQLNVSGGHIRNIAVGAAFIAADGGAAIGMRELQQATQNEAAKRDRPFAEGETRGWL